MNEHVQVRNRTPLERKGGKFVVACPPMKSNVNVSMIARSASCLGATTLVITGHTRVDKHIARDHDIEVKHRNSLLPALKKYKAEGYKVVGIEQTSNSHSLYEHDFSDESTVLVVGHECKGMEQEILDFMDEVVEIPLFGNPHSLNVGVAASICLYEYAKQRNVGRE